MCICCFEYKTAINFNIDAIENFSDEKNGEHDFTLFWIYRFKQKQTILHRSETLIFAFFFLN